jgi:hypothetical protein
MRCLKKRRQIFFRLMTSVAIFIASFCLALYFFRKNYPSFSKYTHSQEYVPKHPNWKLRKQNPPPPERSKKSPIESLYVMIIDQEYSAQPFQCLFVDQWVNEMAESEYVDGIEIYSLNAWTNKECNISSITISQLPKHTINPSAFLALRSMQLALKRTDAEWFFMINDAAYINVRRFLDFFDLKKRTTDNRKTFMIGSCVEERYFFQMLLFDSGVLMSRDIVEMMADSENDHRWDVAFQTALTADEIFAEIADKNGISISSKQTHEFLGRGFRNIKDYDRLREKNFEGLPHCKIPIELLVPGPSQLGICSAQVFRMGDMSVWSALRGMSKMQFLEEAAAMLSALPENLGYYWDRLYPTLCLRN